MMSTLLICMQLHNYIQYSICHNLSYLCTFYFGGLDVY